METVIDKFGRIVIPKKLRDDLGLKPGSIIKIEANRNELLLKPLLKEYPLELKEGVLIFTGKPSGHMGDEIYKIREERLKSFYENTF